MKYNDYLDKVKACWLGKNIGGTLGAPFEGVRGAFDVEYYVHDISTGMIANDDLDLQLLWLNAAEKFGTMVDSEILSTYWLTGVTAYWSEYGAGMNNMEYGILPPASGSYRNQFKESCGAFIRSEIWACLAPGHPEIAVKYAYEDACVDHSGDGLWAELFCAALQSAAFVESDPDTLIDIALSYIPQDCGIAEAIKVVRAAYAEGVTWKEARKRILQIVPCTFGMRYGPEEDGIPVGKLGYDAAANIGLMVLGWLFGENDFARSICIAAGCGEDCDCTAGTLAATFGIINGTASIDKKWSDPIGDEIKTIAITHSSLMLSIPRTVSELSARVARLMPTFMKEHIQVSSDGYMEIVTDSNMSKQLYPTGWMEKSDVLNYMYHTDVVAKKNSTLFDVHVMMDNLDIKENEEKEIRLRFMNRVFRHLWSNIRVDLRDEFGETHTQNHACCLNEYTSGSNITEQSIKLQTGELKGAKYTLTLTITTAGYPTQMHIPIMLVRVP